mmetsp:Transcript_18470/g.35146  ORF Transcript_18470/g.35146 Transcript_18470/m.35146 type:complete len:124 (-) Transcript_18470:347-718(-)|eukprot:CAMPEP_0114233092 /NCGR_PEP_ID=MMETSP0058-20121206/4968_1 /TAXON_ID=36894 /ORGANISM="Pyramimonas parkeae, CCMP726" /LENGTH=123 /DNA_ID=CAMNT_0001344635 /DNA_START=65 /DNA_END=436 /DNA_ORIENTATION=+
MAPMISQTASAFAGKLQISDSKRSVKTRAQVRIVAQKPAVASEFRSMSNEDIDKEVETIKRSLFDLRIKKATRQEFKSSDFKFYKKKVATLLTVKRENEIAQGISKRESRALNRSTSVRGSKF